jgi:hypothetical protein
VDTRRRLWMVFPELRYLLIPEEAALPPGPDRIEDVLGRERRVNLAELAAWEVTPAQATSFLEGNLTPVDPPPPPAEVAEDPRDLAALTQILERVAADPQGSIELVARLLVQAQEHPPDALGARWEQELRAAGHDALIEAAERLTARARSIRTDSV